MSHNIENIEDTSQIDVYADLRLTCDAGTLDIKAHNGRAVFLPISSWHIAVALLRVDVLKAVDRALKRIGVTVYWRSSRFAILGSDAKPFLLTALILIQRVSKLMASYAMKLRSASTA